MGKLVGLLLSIVILWWLGWIVFAADPNVRIERTCAPVSGLFGRVAGSVADLARYDEADGVRDWFGEADYSCRYIVWNQFYGDEWRARQKEPPPAEKGAKVAKKEPKPKRMGIDGLPLPDLPGEENEPIRREPLPTGQPKKIEPLPPGVVPPPVRVEPALREEREVAPPTAPTPKKADSIDDIVLPAKRPPGEVGPSS
jgi:hypothetical protein